MQITSLLLVFALGSYVVASVLSIVAFVRVSGANERRGLIAALVGAAGLVLMLARHGIASHQLPIFDPLGVLSIYAISITVIYLFLSLRYPTRSLSIVLLPYVTLLLVLAALCPVAGRPVDPRLYSVWLSLHVLTALVGYAFFTLACVFAATYLFQDRNLKHKRLGPLFHKLPALETLDRLMSSQIAHAFIIFTASIVIGGILTHVNHWQAQMAHDPKIIATLVTWGLYAILFYMRLSADRHGKTMAIITVAGFACVLITFFGVTAFAHSSHNLSTLTHFLEGRPS